MKNTKTELMVDGLLLALLWAAAGYSLVAGHVIIGLYAVAAFWWGIDSKQVIRLAMAALAVAFLTLLFGLYQSATAFTAYTFVLFVVSVFVLGKELWRQSVTLRQARGEEGAREKGFASRRGGAQGANSLPKSK